MVAAIRCSQSTSEPDGSPGGGRSSSGDAWNVGCMMGLDSCPKNPGPDFDIGSGVVLGKLATAGTALRRPEERHGARDRSRPPDRALWTHRVGRGSIQGGIQFGMAFDGAPLRADTDMAIPRTPREGARSSAGPPRPGLYALDPATAIAVEKRGRRCLRGRILRSRNPGLDRRHSRCGVRRTHGRTRQGVRAATGRVLWQYDPPRSRPWAAVRRTAVDRRRRPGGYHGMVYTNSGYGLYFHMPATRGRVFGRRQVKHAANGRKQTVSPVSF